MKTILYLMVSALLLFATHAFGEQNSTFTTEVNIASKWLLLVDEGDHVRSWHQFSPIVQARFNDTQWQQTIESLREPLGELVSRELSKVEKHTALPGVPDGNYLVIEYLSDFTQSEETQEVVTLQKMDEIWLILGYVTR